MENDSKTEQNKYLYSKIKEKCLTPLTIYRIVFLICCFGFCFRQIHNICKTYFAYEVSTLVYYENVLSVSVPALTLCTHKSDLLRAEIKTKLGDNPTEKEIEDYLNTKTVADQLKELYSAEDFFGNDCKIMRPHIMSNITDDFVSCDLIAPIRTSLDYHNICFTLFSQFNEEPKSKYTFDFDVSIKNYFLEIISFRVKVNVSAIHLFIHYRKDKISDSFDYNHIQILYKPWMKSCVKYHITEIHLLGKPYATDCIDYNSIGYHSVLDCLLQCKIRTLKQSHQGWPGTYLNYNGTNEKMVDILSIMGNNSSLDLKMGKECRKSCGYNSDCYKEYFNFFEVKIPDPRETGFLVNVFAPDFPNLIYLNRPKMETEEMVCFVASILGLCFGFSLIQVSERMIIGFKIMSKYFLIYNQTQTQNNVLVLKNNYYGNERQVKGYGVNKTIFNNNNDYNNHI